MPRFGAAVLAVLGLAAAGCLDDAPRDNPLDPLAEGFRDEGEVSGSVTGVYPPFPGRAGVLVRLVPTEAGRPELATRTDGQGHFGLPEVPAGTYAVVAEGEGFREDADTVQIAAGGSAEVMLQLDALPVVEAQSLRTVHISRWFPTGDVYQLEVEAEVTDPDAADDVAGAALVVPALGFEASLEPVAGQAGRFVAVFDAAEMPGGLVQNLLGHPIRVRVTDVAGNAGLGEPVSLVRVIEQTPETVSPQGFEPIAEASPLLVWRPAQLPFAFTYLVDLYFVDGAGIPNLVEQQEEIAATETSYRVLATLPPGDYYWTVWVVDAAGNRSRSKQAGFQVVGG